jgi:hypothetical protein
MQTLAWLGFTAGIALLLLTGSSMPEETAGSAAGTASPLHMPG